MDYDVFLIFYLIKQIFLYMYLIVSKSQTDESLGVKTNPKNRRVNFQSELIRTEQQIDWTDPKSDKLVGLTSLSCICYG